MTPIGHTLTGIAIGYLAIPRATPLKPKATLLAAFVVLANAPDLPFPYWGHDRYDISHSLFATTLGVLLLESALLWRFRGRTPVGWRVMAGLALCWYSHLLLDTLYSHAIGLAIFWPWNETRVALPIPWLHSGDRTHVFSIYNVRVAIFEILSFTPLVVMAYLIKKAVVPNPGSARDTFSS